MGDNKQHITDIVFVLALFCVFAVLALFVVVIGADVYKDITANMNENYDARTSVTYLTERVRQNDDMDGIRVDAVEGKDALVFVQDLGDQTFETWIFVANGELREVLVKQDAEVHAESGQPIMQLMDMQIQEQDTGGMEIKAVDSTGKEFSSLVGIKSGA